MAPALIRIGRTAVLGCSFMLIPLACSLSPRIELAAQTASEPPPTTISVINYNMLHGWPRFRYLSQRRSLLLQELHRVGVDIVLLQEVPRRPQPLGHTGSFLARGAEEGNTLMIAPELEHHYGFSFLRNSAIDQHIDTRDRWDDLREIILVYPDLLGIGISEATAILVRDDEFEVVGRGQVAIHDFYRRFTYADSLYYLVLDPGERYDMSRRRRIAPVTEELLTPRLRAMSRGLAAPFFEAIRKITSR